MSLLQKLKVGKIDLIGDIHGELEALLSLVYHLGYNEEGIHSEGRTMVFVGDLCDRGPDTPGVFKLVKKWVENGNAQMVLGNHEINLLQDKEKDGAGWFFKEREKRDSNYEPFVRVKDEEREDILNFISNLPLALENDELRVVHAAWSNESIEKIKSIPMGNVKFTYEVIENEINEMMYKTGLLEAYSKEQEIWCHAQEDSEYEDIPFLDHVCEYNLVHQMNNPFRVITSGVEQRCENPFYTSGKWRFVERHTWWDSYEDEKPVVVGHFWRKINENKSKYKEEDVFNGISPFEWHGLKRNVFCVDFSVGARFKERLNNKIGENTHLAALRWPEKILMLENGEVISTQKYME